MARARSYSNQFEFIRHRLIKTKKKKTVLVVSEINRIRFGLEQWILSASIGREKYCVVISLFMYLIYVYTKFLRIRIVYGERDINTKTTEEQRFFFYYRPKSKKPAEHAWPCTMNVVFKTWFLAS